MRIFVTILLSIFVSCAAAQSRQLFWAHSKVSSSTALTIYAASNASGSGSTGHSLTGVPAGALLVVTMASETYQTTGSVTSSPSLTWTIRADAQDYLSGDAEIWTALYTAGGSISITGVLGGGNQTSVAYTVINQEATLSGTSAVANLQAAPSVNLLTTRTNSIIFAVSSDWNASNGARTYRSSPVEQYYNYASGASTSYHYYKPAPTITTYTMGLSLPADQQSGTAVYEVRGN